MDILPNEIISMIFSADRSSLHVVHIVCTNWREISTCLIKSINSKEQFEAACAVGDCLSILHSKIEHNWDKGLYYACKSGNIRLINLVILKGIDGWDWGLCGACRGGHTELAKLMILKGADDWDASYYYACRGGHTKLANLMIAKGSTRCNYCKCYVL